ncbi:MAG: hypothetical protein IJT49_00590 [Clostridia bacterium]|nr:hypothetical protein [Clostridia bacterium]
MFWVLLKKQFTEIFKSYFYNPKNNTGRSSKSTVVMFIIFGAAMVFGLGGMFTALALALCASLHSAGADWLYYAILGLTASAMGVFGSVFSTYSGLYLAKDNDLLLSMPIPVKYIIAARLSGVYLMGLIYSGTATVPAFAVYLIFGSFSFWSVTGGLMFVLLISVIVLILSCMLGWIVAKISLKLKNKSFITVIISVLFIGGYYFVYFKAREWINALIENAAEYGAKIKGAAYGLYLFGQAGTGNRLPLIIFTLSVTAAAALVWFIIERSFIKTATSSAAVSGKAYREKTVKMRGAGSALFSKELKRFTSSANYMLNSGFGCIFMAAAAVALFIKGDLAVTALNGFSGGRLTAVIALFAFCFMVSMIGTAAPSVALEGKNYWITRSMPVSSYQILLSKLQLQLAISGGASLPLIAAVVFVLRKTPFEGAAFAAAALSLIPLYALWQMFWSLKNPNLNWTSELIPIKQSMNVAVPLFTGWGYTAVTGGACMLTGYFTGGAICLAFLAALNLILSLLLWNWLKNKGAAKYDAL